jgi:alkylhydroperoxidase family enzyme
MNIPSLPKIEDLSQHINDERKMLEERLAVLRASGVEEKLRQFNSLRTQLEAIHKELLEISAGRLVQGPISHAVSAPQSLTQPTVASAATRRERVSREEAFSKIVRALKEAGSEGLNRSSLSEKTGLGVPKVDEAIKSKKEMFEISRGPKAMVRLVDLAS